MSSQSTQTAKKNRFFYGYVVLAACFLAMMMVYGAQYSFGVFLKPLLTEFGWSRAVTASAYSMNLILFGVFSIFTGRLCDRLGPRLVVTISGILVAGSYLLMSQINEIWQISLLYGLMLSLGMAGINIPLQSTIARWFHARRGVASGIVYAGIGVGTILMPPLSSFLITNYDWRFSFMVIGFITLTIPLIAQLLKVEKKQSTKGEDTDSEAQAHRQALNIQGFTLKQALRTRQFWLMSGIFMIMNICLQTVMVHLVAYATDMGIIAAIAATILSVIGIASTISKVAVGVAVDRFQCKRIWIVVSIFMLGSFLLLQIASELWVLYLFAVIYAIGYGGFSTTQSPTVAEFFGLKAHGAIYGFAALFGSLGGAIGPYFTGMIFDMTGSYQWAFMGCALTGAVALIFSILLKPTEKNPGS